MSAAIDPTDAGWALNLLRTMLRDTAEPYAFESEYLASALEVHAFTHDEVMYYRPHAAAATIIRTDPDRLTSEGIDNVQATYQNPHIVAAALLREYRAIDRRIEALTGRPMPQGASFGVAF